MSDKKSAFEPLFYPDRKGYETIFITEADDSFGLRCHDYWQIIIHRHGSVQFAVNDEVYFLTPDRLIIVPPYHMHGVTDVIDPDIRQVFVNFTPDFLQIAGIRQINFEQILLDLTAGSRYCFPMRSHDADVCELLLRKISENADDTTPWSRFSDISRLFPVIRLIIETMQNDPTQAISSVPGSIMHDVLVYINANYTKKLTLQNIARHFGISVSTLSHDFKEYTHHSVYGYILYRRIMTAKERLYEDTPLNEIAYECGFSDYSNFLRSFTKQIGMSPSEYRRSLNSGI